jgi:hypothetical protein
MLAASSAPVFSSFTATAAPFSVNPHTLPKKPLPSPASVSTGFRSARLSPRPSANNKSTAGTRNLASTTTAAAAAGGAHTRPSGHIHTQMHKQTRTNKSRAGRACHSRQARLHTHHLTLISRTKCTGCQPALTGEQPMLALCMGPVHLGEEYTHTHTHTHKQAHIQTYTSWPSLLL